VSRRTIHWDSSVHIIVCDCFLLLFSGDDEMPFLAAKSPWSFAPRSKPFNVRPGLRKFAFDFPGSSATIGLDPLRVSVCSDWRFWWRRTAHFPVSTLRNFLAILLFSQFA
jgi:hypothetical protein